MKVSLALCVAARTVLARLDTPEAEDRIYAIENSHIPIAPGVRGTVEAFLYGLANPLAVNEAAQADPPKAASLSAPAPEPISLNQARVMGWRLRPVGDSNLIGGFANEGGVFFESEHGHIWVALPPQPAA